MIWLGVNWSNTITLGSLIVGVIVGAAGLAVFAYGAKWKGAFDVSEARADELSKALNESRASLDRCNESMKESRKALDEAHTREAVHLVEIEKLQALPNLARVIETVTHRFSEFDQLSQQRLVSGIDSVQTFIHSEVHAHDERAAERWETYDQRALERHKAQLNVLVALADSLREGRRDQE